MANKTIEFIHIWNSKYGTPYITFCEENGTPIFSMEFKSLENRTRFLNIKAKKTKFVMM